VTSQEGILELIEVVVAPGGVTKNIVYNKVLS
jgi:hypothetical protein